jgi:hypothetical protein
MRLLPGCFLTIVQDNFLRICLSALFREQYLLAMHPQEAGACGAVMTFFYNTRPLGPEVLLVVDDITVIRKRPRIDELISLDSP